MNYLIAYDISDDRLRLKLSKFLLKHACERLQKSMYIAPAYSPTEWAVFLQDLHTLVQKSLILTDSILIIPVQQQQLIDSTTFGNKKALDTFLKEIFYFFF